MCFFRFWYCAFGALRVCLVYVFCFACLSFVLGVCPLFWVFVLVIGDFFANCMIFVLAACCCFRCARYLSSSMAFVFVLVVCLVCQ